MTACRVTCQPSKVLPSYIYVVHIDPVCPKCTPTKATNLPVKQTCSEPHAEYLEFCRCLLDEDRHRRWREMLVTLDVSNPDAWMRYAAKYATLPPLPAQLALPAPVWSFVSSMMLLYLQPVLLAALAERMRGPLSPVHAQRLQCTLRSSVQDHTWLSLWKLTTGYYVSTSSYPSGTTTVGVLECPVRYLVSFLSPALQPDTGLPALCTADIAYLTRLEGHPLRLTPKDRCPSDPYCSLSGARYSLCPAHTGSRLWQHG